MLENVTLPGTLRDTLSSPLATSNEKLADEWLRGGGDCRPSCSCSMSSSFCSP